MQDIKLQPIYKYTSYMQCYELLSCFDSEQTIHKLAQNKRSKIRTKGCDTTKTKIVRGVKIIQRNINTPAIEENLEVERMYTKIALSEKY